MKLYTIIFFAAVCSLAMAAEDGKVLPPGGARDNNGITFPYIAEITGNNVNIRSGSGNNYYSCGKLNSQTQVVVVDQSYRWSKILPPPGSFSWIFKDYVTISADDPTVGIVNGDNVRVYAGSQTREPIRSDSMQVKLKAGQKVRILGPVQNDYYKISPPQGATLWVYTEYTKFVRPADEIEVAVTAKQPKYKVEESLKPVIAPTVATTTAESKKLKEYYQLIDKIEAEAAKPIGEQDFADLKKALIQMRDDPQSGKTGKYAKYAIKRIERCELAKQAGEELAAQQKQLQDALKQIAEARQKKLKAVSDKGAYAVVGRISPSAVYDTPVKSKRYLVTDPNGAVICYAQPFGVDVEMKDFLGKTVGLIGTIVPDTKSNLAMVEFSKIAELKND